MKLKAKIFDSNKPNANGVVYDTEALKEAVERYNKKERYAVGGEYPPKGIATNVDDLVGASKLRYEDGSVIATIELLKSQEEKLRKAFEECVAPIKIIPTCVANYESIKAPVDNIMITHIVCTCSPVDTGDDDEMFFAEKIEDE